MHGKLNGVMPATTPSGAYSLQLSTPPPTFIECSPLSRCGMPQANSTTSMPRVSSPRASDSTLPCSALIARAIASASRASSSLNLNRMRARLSGVVAAQAGNACRGDSHRGAHFFGGGQRDLLGDRSGGRVVDVGAARAPPPLECPPFDEVRDLLHQAIASAAGT